MRKRYPFFTFIAVAAILFFIVTAAHSRPKPASSKGLIVVANQFEHTALIVDPDLAAERQRNGRILQERLRRLAVREVVTSLFRLRR